MINLLPPKHKKRLEKEKKFKIIVVLNILVLFLLIALSVIFFLTRVSLEEQLKSEKSIFESSQKQEKIKEAENLENEIEEFNKSIAKLENHYQNYFNISEILQTFSSTLPPKTYINNISINRGEKEDIIGEIKAQGFCPNRETLRIFDNNLNDEENFIDINFAKEDWTQPVDIEFSVNLKIKK